jgi:hypothetical protein
MSEFHSILGQSIDIRGLVKRAAEATEISRPKVVHQHEDDVWFVGQALGCVANEWQQQKRRGEKNQTALQKWARGRCRHWILDVQMALNPDRHW